MNNTTGLDISENNSSTYFATIAVFSIIVGAGILRLFAINNGVRNLLFLPYPAACMLFGIFLGGLSFATPHLQLVKELVAFHQGGILFLAYFPPFIFKSLMLLNWQDFRKEWKQILVFGIIGQSVSFFLYGFAYAYFSKEQTLSLLIIVTYGSLIGATDLGENLSGYSQARHLRVLLEGESLISTVFTLIIFEYGEGSNLFGEKNSLVIIFLGTAASILVAIIVGKIFAQVLNYEKCDYATYVCTSVATSYLLYIVMEPYSISGVMALIAFGLFTLPAKARRESGNAAYALLFWRILFYAVSFVLCTIAGVSLIMNLVLLYLWDSFLRIFSLYLFLLSVRACKIILLKPILQHLGHGISWSAVIALIWGGMHGTICLVYIIVFESPNKEDETARALLRVNGIGAVLLNQILNGMTLKPLMLGLGLLPNTHVNSVDKVLRHLEDDKITTAHTLHTNPLFADAQWSCVEEATVLERGRHSTAPALMDTGMEFPGVRHIQCPACRSLLPETMKVPENFEFEQSIRRKVLKAQKISYTRQYAQELISSEAYEVLCSAIETAYHLPVPAIRSAALQHHWTMSKFQSRLYFGFIKMHYDSDNDSTFSKHWLLKFVGGVCWEWWVMGTVVLHTIAVAVDILDFTTIYTEQSITLAMNYIVILQIFAELYAFRLLDMKSFFWCVLDCFVFTIGCLTIIGKHYEMDPTTMHVIAGLGLLRLLRLFRVRVLIKRTFPLVSRCLNNQISKRMVLGYDIGKGFIIGNEETLKMLPKLVSNQGILGTIQEELEQDRLKVIREIELIQRYWPIAVSSLKTRECALSLIRRMQNRAVELSSAGMLDEEEVGHLVQDFTDQRVNIKNKLKIVQPRTASEILEKIEWLQNDPATVSILSAQAMPWRLSPSKMVLRCDDPPEGLLIVCSGLVKCNYVPDPDALLQLQELGCLPNLDYPRHLHYAEPQVDYAWEGCVLGEIGVLTRRKHNITAVCETNVLLTYISLNSLQPVLPRVRTKMWLSFGCRIAAILLSNAPGYETWTHDRIKTRLTSSICPDLSFAVSFNVRDLAENVFLIDGVIIDSETHVQFKAPCILPQGISKFLLPRSGRVGFPHAAPPPQIIVLPYAESENLSVTTSPEGEVVFSTDNVWCPLHDPSAAQ